MKHANQQGNDMNSLPQQALDRAREKPASKLLPKILANEPVPELVINSPIYRVMELEAKHWPSTSLRA